MIVHGGDEQIADHLEGFGGSVGESFKTLYQGPMRFADDGAPRWRGKEALMGT